MEQAIIDGNRLERIVREAARWTLESRVGVPLRSALDRSQIKRAKQIVQFSVANYGWRSMSGNALRELRERKCAERLYLLGSGSSVNQIPSEIWQEMQSQVSVGINHWTIHNFIPDIYAIETVPDHRREALPSSYPLEINHLNHLKVLDRRAIHDSDVSIWCLAPRSDGENEQLQNIPRNLWDKTFVYYRFTPVTRQLSNLTNDLRSVISYLRFDDSSLVLPDSGASLVRLVILGMVSGFREIILVGVDLSTTYFWQEHGANIFDDRFVLFEQPMTGKHHETLSTLNRPFSVVEMMHALLELSSELGVKLIVEALPSELTRIVRGE